MEIISKIYYLKKIKVKEINCSWKLEYVWKHKSFFGPPN